MYPSVTFIPLRISVPDGSSEIFSDGSAIPVITSIKSSNFLSSHSPSNPGNLQLGTIVCHSLID
jgi:hypothetical protein